jgi:hypothetical protein
MVVSTPRAAPLLAADSEPRSARAQRETVRVNRLALMTSMKSARAWTLGSRLRRTVARSTRRASSRASSVINHVSRLPVHRQRPRTRLRARGFVVPAGRPGSARARQVARATGARRRNRHSSTEVLRHRLDWRATLVAQVGTAAVGHAIHTWVADPSSDLDTLIVRAFTDLQSLSDI